MFWGEDSWLRLGYLHFINGLCGVLRKIPTLDPVVEESVESLKVVVVVLTSELLEPLLDLLGFDLRRRLLACETGEFP